MRKCDKKVKKGQSKRRQNNKGNSNDGWMGEVKEWIKRRQSNKRNSKDDWMGELKEWIKRRQNNRGNSCKG